MKKYRIASIGISACLVLGTVMLPTATIEAQAVDIMATVPGTVNSGTTSELLLLGTKEGEMQIKIDSSTDTSECKMLLPNSKISVSVTHGSDGYLHAVKIYGTSQTPGVSLDFSTSATVTGTIEEKSKDDVLYFKTSAGVMEIKLDTTTDMSGCRLLVADKTYSITCVRGSDAYMHAVSISDSAAGSSSSSSGGSNPSYTPAPVTEITNDTSWVTGTVNDKTKEDLIYFSTGGGEMQIKVDSNTDSRNGIVVTPGAKLSISVYRGSDAYMHAAKIVASKESYSTAQLDSSTTATVTGTVGSKSNENLLYLETTGGVMELKLDSLGSVTSCKILVSGKKVSVTCARGSDAYMHATAIAGY
ncbi:MAG: hypothetical protein NC321_16205 [Clostridium sp.]|nr:hypothetical protein [Clostridium sp.]